MKTLQKRQNSISKIELLNRVNQIDIDGSKGLVKKIIKSRKSHYGYDLWLDVEGTQGIINMFVRLDALGLKHKNAKQNKLPIDAVSRRTS